MEELKVEYEIKSYGRDPNTMRAPDALKKVHPLGKSPVIEIYKDGSEPPLVLAESGHIVQYLVENYDVDKKFSPSNPHDKVLLDYYLHFAEGSLQSFLVPLIINSAACLQAPFGFGYMTKLVTNGINQGYFYAEVKKILVYLEDNLAKKSTNRYFVGDSLTGADILLSYPIIENVFANVGCIKNQLGGDDFDQIFPNLLAWTKSIAQEPNYIKAVEIEEEKTKEFGFTTSLGI